MAIMLFGISGNKVYEEDISQIFEKKGNVRVEDIENSKVMDQNNISEDNSVEANENVMSVEEPKE